jgi:hypothetical protein
MDEVSNVGENTESANEFNCGGTDFDSEGFPQFS